MTESGKEYAVITGASKGIGKSIAVAMAKRGFNLIIAARSENELLQFKADLVKNYGIRVETIVIDLCKQDAPEILAEQILFKNYRIIALINNAGYGLWGNFAELQLSEQMEMCRLNMDVVIKLCHLFIPNLLKQKQSYILNVSSTAAYQALPQLAIYAATKAFVLSFTRGLRFELKSTSVSVSCLSPGPVDTGFAHRAGMDAFSKMAEKFNMAPDAVAEIAVKGMLAGKSEIIPGFTNLLGVYANRILPKFFIEKMAAGIYKV